MKIKSYYKMVHFCYKYKQQNKAKEEFERYVRLYRTKKILYLWKHQTMLSIEEKYKNACQFKVKYSDYCKCSKCLKDKKVAEIGNDDELAALDKENLNQNKIYSSVFRKDDIGKEERKHQEKRRQNSSFSFMKHKSDRDSSLGSFARLPSNLYK